MFHKPTTKEIIRDQKRDMSKSQRELARDRTDLDRQETQLVAEIKKMAKQGNDDAARILAKQLVRLRAAKTKNVATSAKVTSIGAQTTVMHSQLKMAGAMAGATKAMSTMNKQINVQQLQATMQDFEKQSMTMDMKEDIMNDTIDSIMDGDDDEEESTNIMNQVLDEIGIDVNTKMASAPRHELPDFSESSSSKASMSDIEARMAKLKQ